GVEEAVAEHLREKDLDAGAGEAGDVDVVFAQSIELVDRYARHPLHHHDVTAAPIPVHLRYQQQRRVQKIAPELRAISRLASEIELTVDGLLELGHHLPGPQSLAVAPESLYRPCPHVHQGEILIDGGGDVG